VGGRQPYRCYSDSKDTGELDKAAHGVNSVKLHNCGYWLVDGRGEIRTGNGVIRILVKHLCGGDGWTKDLLWCVVNCGVAVWLVLGTRLNLRSTCPKNITFIEGVPVR
jgi:hypothetical protein